MGNENPTIKHRNEAIDIAKGIGIILMVMGHSGCPKMLFNFIYLFHMPLFFFCSGYFFHPTNKVSDTIKKRIKGLYLPFIKWSIPFLLLHNICFNLNIYNESYGFNGIASSLYDLKTYLTRLFYIIFYMSGSEQLLGGFWFLKVLFISSIGISLLYFIKQRIHSIQKLSTFQICILLTIIAIISVKLNIRIPVLGELHQLSLAAIFYLIGYSYRQIENTDNYNWIFTIITLSLILICSLFYVVSMTELKTPTNVIPFIITGSIGSISIISLSNLIHTHKITKYLRYVGGGQ